MSAREEIEETISTLLIASNPVLSKGIERLCKESARKAVNEVLERLIVAESANRHGIYQLKYTAVSDPVLRKIADDAVERCCE